MKTLYRNDDKHHNNFDFTRVVLAAMVVLCHSYVIYSGTLATEPLWHLSGHQLSIGTCAINFFFSISGFLISQSWDRSEGYFPFLTKRIVRIYPGFIVVCILCAFVFAPLGLHHLAAIPAYLGQINFRHLVLTTCMLREPALPDTFLLVPLPKFINASLWSIPYEFACYQAIPLLALAGIIRKPARMLVTFAGLLLINLLHFTAYELYVTTGALKYELVSYYPQRYFELLIGFEHLLLPFMAGALFYSGRHYIPRSPYLAILSGASLLVTLRWIPYFEIAQAICGTYLLFYFIFNERVTFPRFARYGDFSYGIYLYGWPIQQLLMLYAGNKLTVYGLFFAALALVLPLAVLSWHIVEKPFLQLKRWLASYTSRPIGGLTLPEKNYRAE